MKVALVYPRTESEDLEVMPIVKEPLGACCISAALKQREIESRVFHQVGLSDAKLVDEVRDFGPDVVGFQTLTYNFDKGKELAGRIKEELGGVPVVVGGDHVSGCVAHYQEFPDLLENVLDWPIDFVVRGEGERTIIGLLDAIQGKRDLGSVRGIGYRKDGKVRLTAARARIENLDDLPFPDRDDLPFNEYFSRGFTHTTSGKIGTQHTLRGCRFRCDFCSTPITWPGGLRGRSVEGIVDEQQQMLERYDIKLIHLADEDGTYDLDRLEAIAEERISRGFPSDFGWWIFGRITDILRDTGKSKRVLDKLKKSNCTHLFYGIESTNLNTLKRVHKGITVEQMKKALDITRDVGIDNWAGFMLGYPWESRDDILRSVERLNKLPLTYIYFTFVTPFPGTPLYADCRRKGLLLTDDFSEYDCSKPIIKTQVAPDELEKIRLQAKVGFYTHPEYVARALEDIERERPGLRSARIRKYVNFFRGELDFAVRKNSGVISS